MNRLLICLMLVANGCTRGSTSTPIDPDISTQDAGHPGQDGGAPDAGPPEAGTPDAGTPDAGTPDAGTPDGGPDAGPPAPPPPDPHRIGGLGKGPWPTAPLTIYGSAQGLLESPISASTDEAENLWVVSEKALYLLMPGMTSFRRFTAADGLHVGPGYTEPPDFTLVQGGGPGECFVGYYAHDTFDPPHTEPQFAHTDRDPVAHLGKMDQVLIRPSGALEVRRYDFHNTNDWHYYETRTVMSAVYDHFQHPGGLYVGSNHGITRVVPAKWRLPRTSSEQADPYAVEREWYGDHVHPWVCKGGPCSDPTKSSAFGDFFGLTLAADGRLWMGGLTSAGAVHWKPDLAEWIQSWSPHNPFDPAMGDDPWSVPLFNPTTEGDSINVRAVAVTPDNIAWFASGEVESWRGRTYGLASWDPQHPATRFVPWDPMQLGSSEYNILELVALPDGRLVLGFPSTGLLVWKPGDPKGHRVTQRDGLPGESIRRMSLDLMVDPPALLVSTEGGLAVFRQVP